MIRDIFAVAWKEWQEFVQQQGRSRTIGPVRGLAMVAVGGIFVGWQLDPDFGRSWLTALLMTFLTIMFVTTVVPDAFAGERERHTLETLLASRLPDAAIVLGKVAAAVSYGWAIALAVLPVGVASANLIHGSDGLRWVDPAVVGAAVALSLLAGLVIAGIGVQLSLYAPTARQAHQRLGFVMVGIFMTPALVVSAVPTERLDVVGRALESVGLRAVALYALGFLAAAGVALLLVALVRFRRARLIV